ncbi:LytTR family DNA-binding domain-containing protein [Geothrix sp. PMB-07]|uniref:LytR/AlgR family response regulator transcription factor n=1 Tax=Geothrix sp. PMB-07 TaxID=3068640 RepID=UPI0027406CAE|nr:response regulator [Geothrix sp. PMB-07]WLT30923.1 response regulator [Geothrix sp. PMB-07]
MSLKALIADDEPIARQRLVRLLMEADCEVIGEVKSGYELITWAPKMSEIDALFLDVQMPGLTSFEALAELPNFPRVVFITAYTHYTLQAFELAAIDYIIKPVTAERLSKTLVRLSKLNHNKPETNIQSNDTKISPLREHKIAIKAGSGLLFVDIKRVSYFEVDSDTVYAITTDKFRTTWRTLKEVELSLPEEKLIRIHRHLLIRPNMIIGFRLGIGGRGKIKMVGGSELLVSRKSLPLIKSALGL